MHEKTVLIFVMGKWSHSNASIQKALQIELSDHRLITIDLLEAFKANWRAMLPSLLDLPLIAWHALLDRRFDKSNLLYAPVTSRTINRLACRLTQQHAPAFTIQTTGRFNASSALAPHFTIIDSTVAAARQGYRDLFHSSERALDDLHRFQHDLFHASTVIFAMGSYVRDSLMRDYHIPPKQAICIGAGPNIPLGAPSKVMDSQAILFVGTDWVRKGGPDLLAAFERLQPAFPNAVLQIIGCNPEIRQSGVCVLGRIAPERLHHYFSQARIFALPTVHEAFGIAFVEALHFGLPIVATDINAIPEMVSQGVNGYMVAPGDVDGLYEALHTLMGNDMKAVAFGQASLQRAGSFTWQRVAGIIAAHARLWSQLAHQHSRYALHVSPMIHGETGA